MFTLLIDAAGRDCLVALCDGDTVLTEERIPAERGLADRLFATVNRHLAEAGHSADDLRRIGVTTGPGGFTGIRLGLAVAQGLATGTGAELVSIDRFEIFRQCAFRPQSCLVVIDSRRNDLFWREFSTEASSPQMSASADLIARFAGSSTEILGDGITGFATDWQAADSEFAHGPSAFTAVHMLAALSAAGKAGTEHAQPLYIRAPDTGPQLKPAA